MSTQKVYTAIGLMSGTSLDGEIDVALIRTDGADHVEILDFKPFPYDIGVRDKVRACFGMKEPNDQTREAEALITDLHIQAVKASGFEADVIGFHGQTITHDPENGFTWQLGDARRLADETGMDVVFDLRQDDVKAGGQGAPLIPVYHRAITASIEKPVAVLNLGGVANVTYIGGNNEMLAFDCGPANALIDDYAKSHFDVYFDEGGKLAEAGKADRSVIDEFLAHPYFQVQPPKSLDRNEFESILEKLPADKHDAIATLTVMSASAIMAAVKHFPTLPKSFYVCGGGRKNDFMMRLLEDMLMPARVYPIEEVRFDGNAIEAQGFAYLAVRSLLGYPLTYPSTTGVQKPITGGKLFKSKG